MAGIEDFCLQPASYPRGTEISFFHSTDDRRKNLNKHMQQILRLRIRRIRPRIGGGGGGGSSSSSSKAVAIPSDRNVI
jgi:hypothetical protein